MSDNLRCGLCDLNMRVSEDDPDATVDEMVHHVARVHQRDPLLGEPNLIILESPVSGPVDPTKREPTHWVGDAPTSLHGNGAASFAHTTRDPAEVTCGLCLTILGRVDPTKEDKNA